MSQRASVVIAFKAEGAADVKRAMAGIVNETKRASSEARRAIESEKAALRAKTAAERKASRDEVQAQRAAKKQIDTIERASTKAAANEAKSRLMAQRSALKAEADAVRAAERMKRDESKRTSQEARRLAQADAREFTRQARSWQRHSAQQERDRVAGGRARGRTIRNDREATDNGIAMVGAGMLGAGTMIAGAAMAYGAENLQRSRQWVGMDDEDALVSRWGATHLQAKTTAGNAGRPVAEIEGLMMRASEGYGVAPDVSSELFANIQDSFTDQMGSVIEHWEVINQMSAAYGADLRGVARSGAIVQRNFGVAQEDYDDALAIMAGSTRTGAINIGELSTQFGTTPTLLNQAFGDRVAGLSGAQTFSTFAQISGKSGLEGTERATATDRFLQELNDPETWKRLREATGGRVSITEGRGASERLRDPRAVMEALMSPEFNRAGVIGDVFQSLPARQFLAGHRTAGMGYYDQLMAESTPEAGFALMSAQMESRAQDPAWLAQQDVGRQASTVYRQAPGLVARARQQTGYISEWNAANVGTSEWFRTPLSFAASAAESIYGGLDQEYGGTPGAYTRDMAARRGGDPGSMYNTASDWLNDPRIAFRAMMGGDTGEVSDSWMGRRDPLIGQGMAGANMGSLVSGIIGQAGGNLSPGAGMQSLVQSIISQATGQGGGGGGAREVTDPIVQATRESATRIEGAISRINLTPPPAVGGTTRPTE